MFGSDGTALRGLQQFFDPRTRHRDGVSCLQAAGDPGRVFGRDELLDLVWGRDGFVEPRTVDVHLARLRGKFLGAKLPAPDVETVRGVGYRFREPDKRSV